MEKDLGSPFFNQLRPFNELFLKPAEDGSSIDVFKITCNKDLENAILGCVDPRRTFILEESIDFKELTVPILNGRCLPAVEIKTSESFYNFNAKYVNADTQLTELVLSKDEKTVYVGNSDKDNNVIELWGDGSNIRDFVYSEDVARILARACALLWGAEAGIDSQSGVGEHRMLVCVICGR